MDKNNSLQIVQVAVSTLKASEYNPRRWNESQTEALKESIRRFGLCDPLLANSAPGREHTLIGGHFRLKVAKDLKIKDVPVVYVCITDLEKEKELNVRLNKNVGEFDFSLLKEFDEVFLKDAGFSTEELDEIFAVDPTPENFDLEKELSKIGIMEVTVQKGDVYETDGFRLMCGDSTVEADVFKLMGDEKADMVLTDPPYILDYLRGKKKGGQPTE